MSKNEILKILKKHTIWMLISFTIGVALGDFFSDKELKAKIIILENKLETKERIIKETNDGADRDLKVFVEQMVQTKSSVTQHERQLFVDITSCLMGVTMSLQQENYEGLSDKDAFDIHRQKYLPDILKGYNYKEE